MEFNWNVLCAKTVRKLLLITHSDSSVNLFLFALLINVSILKLLKQNYLNEIITYNTRGFKIL